MLAIFTVPTYINKVPVYVSEVPELLKLKSYDM